MTRASADTDHILQVQLLRWMTDGLLWTRDVVSNSGYVIGMNGKVIAQLRAESVMWFWINAPIPPRTRAGSANERTSAMEGGGYCLLPTVR